MPEYSWDLDFTPDPANHFQDTPTQTIWAETNTLVYEAEKDFDADWQDLDDEGDFILVKNRDDAISRLELHREHVAKRLAAIDEVLKAARKTTSFENYSEYALEDSEEEASSEDQEVQEGQGCG